MNFTKIASIANIRNRIESIPKASGIYKYYVSTEGLKYLRDVNPTQKEIIDNETEVYLLYIGKARNLCDRFKWHLGMINSSQNNILGKWLSTIRHSLMANHTEIDCLSQQKSLNIFMDKYTYLQYMVTKEYDTIEEQLIKESDLPLNIRDNRHKFVQINKRRRDKIYNEYREKFGHIKQKKRVEKIEDEELIKYAKIAEKEGISCKSKFLRWFRDMKHKSASQKRLYNAWDKR